MGSMMSLERELRRAGRADVAAPAQRAAERVAERAVNDGLLDVAYTTLDTPVGKVLVAATARGLVRISFAATYDFEAVLADLSARVSPRLLESPGYFDGVRRELDEYFAGKRTSFDLPLDWRLTGGFGRRVLKRTAQIPYGKVSSYREMAAAAGSPRGARAAGNALGSNPIPIVVPCHRVLHSSGGLGGYGGGLDNKLLLLKLEGAVPAEFER
jgi:methylated-DNA-[protein]-cysteine S-methyltransferase